MNGGQRHVGRWIEAGRLALGTRAAIPFVLAGTLAMSAVGSALGQSNNNGAPAAQQPAPLSVPSHQPGLGGVRSEGPRPIGGIGRTLLPPSPSTFVPGQVGQPATGPFFFVPFGRDRGSVPVMAPSDQGRFVDNGTRTPGFVVGGSGLTVNGRFTDGRFRLGFHLGSGFGPFVRFWRPLWGYPYGWYNSYPYRYYNDYPQTVTSQPYYYVDPFAAGAYMQTPPATQYAAPMRELTPLEQADAALRDGEVQAAIRQYREYLDKTPDDAPAMRSLALALLAGRQPSQAAAVMALAYQKDPSLARRPIDPGQVKNDLSGMRTLVQSAVRYANKVDSGSAWLTVAVLIQGEGRVAVAKKMVLRAKAHGLDAKVADELERELTR